jgi:hypothetical protein
VPAVQNAGSETLCLRTYSLPEIGPHLLCPFPHMQKLLSNDPALRPDAAAVLKACDRQMGPLPLRPSNPSVANLPRTSS